MKLTDATGKVVESYTYGVYGELLSGNADLTHFLYNGRCGVSTEANGLYYMRQRYYNPDIKRFINQDILTGSLDNSQSLNQYSYVQGNPVSYTDPFGLSPVNGLFSDSNDIHTKLTLMGFAPGAGGVVADLLDAGVYLLEGDMGGTALALLAVFCSSAASVGKVARTGKAMNKANKLSDTARLVNSASDMMSNSSSFMKAAMNGTDVTQMIKTTKQSRVIDKLKDTVTSVGNKFKSSKPKLNNIGAVDDRILSPSKWDDMVLDGGVLKKSGSQGVKTDFYVATDGTIIPSKSAKTNSLYDRLEVETYSGKSVRANNAVDDWNEFLGDNQSDINPFTGQKSIDRIWSADGRRSIRFGSHEMDGMGTKRFHYHRETWYDDYVINVVQRIQLK